MDNFSIHLGQVPRRWPTGLPIATIGYDPRKRALVDMRFKTINFSFILSGRGWYEADDFSCEVEAPCVITQWPGAHTRYGPEQTWEELFLIFRADDEAQLRERGLFDPDRPHWALSELGVISSLVTELRDRIRADRFGSEADRIDRIAERMVMESHRATERSMSGPRARVLRIREYVERHYLRDHDFDQLAAECELSPTHFRRLWQELVGTPPARYVIELRMHAACRQLSEHGDSIGTIAEACGFDDPLYFSRRFRAFTGLSPSAYRERYGNTASLKE